MSTVTTTRAAREAIVALLCESGAEEEQHRKGSLLEHLTGTERILEEWQAPPHLVDAGLCHAAYGTDGLIAPLVPLDRRSTLAEVAGERAEALVYFYASCDRMFVYPQFGTGEELVWRDRFTGREFVPDEGLLRDFMELSWANAVDVMRSHPDWDLSDARGFFDATSSLVSDAARAAVRELYERPRP